MAGSVVTTNNVLNSISRQAKTEPFDLQVARNQITGHSQIFIFGYQSGVGSATSIPIWENATPYTYAASAIPMVLTSTSATDTGNVLVQGLDANYSPLSETVTLAGTLTATTIGSYLRCNFLTCVSVPSGQTTNVGTITAKQSSNILAQINVGIGKSQASIYTVPAGYTFYLYQVDVSTDNDYSGAANVLYNVYAFNRNTGVQYSVLQQPFTAIFNANRTFNPFAYSEKTDLQWQLKTSTGTIGAGVIAVGKLIKNSADSNNT